MSRTLLAVLGLACALEAAAQGRGVTPYLPLRLEPEIERQIERVLILADKPVLTRPFAAAVVLDALPRACEIDEALCQQVRRHLRRYMHDYGVGHLALEGAVSGGANKALPNRHGLDSESAWQASASLYYQPSDYALVTLGGVAYEDEATPSGSLISVGISRAQLDIGYRDHWLSPMTDSSMLLSTQAPTMPSVTLSNYVPLTRLGLRYEAFLARQSRSDRIVFGDGFTSGRPSLAGLHLSMEPVSGWALGVNRVMQYGGGERGGASLGDFLDALFQPFEADNIGEHLGRDEQLGNQIASVTSRFLFPGPTPFAVYFEYAGEDTSRGRNYLLGNAALSAGIHFPRLWRRFDLAYEASEWQNAWYAHHIYQEGLTNEGHVIGHWGGDERAPGDAVGAQSHMLRLGWEPAFGGLVEFRYRTLQNERYSAVDYSRVHDVALSYSRPWGPFLVGGEARGGRDAFGEDFTRFAAFVRYTGDARTGGSGAALGGAPRSATLDGAEIFVDAGMSATKVRVDLDDPLPRAWSDTSFDPHFAIGVRRSVSANGDLGARVELGDVDGSLLLAARAIDYRYRLGAHLALTGFVGAARYDLEIPAYGLYLGAGAQWRNLLPGWDLGIDVRLADKVARDNLLPGDEGLGRDDRYYDIFGATLSISRRF